MNGKQIVAQLKKKGWVLKRVKGSHHLMQKNGKTVPVPVHGTEDIKPGLLAALEKQTGVKLK
jgi:predicted RNA binding protein YcfA (HicA-like mRNA interferase family)